MKTYPILFMFAGLMPILCAQEPAKPASDEPIAALLMESGPKSSGRSVLGVSTSALPTVVSEQFGLKHGIVIDFVMADSPAAKAGLKAQDILLQVDDQLMFHPMQLSSLLNYMGAGKNVQLTYLRHGQRAVTRCVLDKVVEEPEATPEPVRQLEEMLKQQGVVGGSALMLGTSIDLGNPLTSITLPDGATMRFSQANGVRRVKIDGPEGKNIFEGPLDTEEQRQAVPEAFRPLLRLAEGAEMESLKNPMSR